jgi:beta-glucanase (GH16 family)
MRGSPGRPVCGAVVLAALSQGACDVTFFVGRYETPGPDAGDDAAATWTLVWHDEFEGPAGAPPDPTLWGRAVGGGGWGNGQLQYHTARTENASLDGNGGLTIRAIAEPYMGLAYTSARLTTSGIFEQAYGRFEISARIPAGSGVWSSFWLTGNDRYIVGWPACGDINVLSVLGPEPDTNRGGAHGPGYGEMVRPSVTLPAGSTFASELHQFAVEWDPDELRFYLDGTLYGTRTKASLPSGSQWVQDHPNFLILDLAVGGHSGTPDPAIFPAELSVDYVRVYSR